MPVRVNMLCLLDKLNAHHIVCVLLYVLVCCVSLKVMEDKRYLGCGQVTQPTLFSSRLVNLVSFDLTRLDLAGLDPASLDLAKLDLHTGGFFHWYPP